MLSNELPPRNVITGVPPTSLLKSGALRGKASATARKQIMDQERRRIGFLGQRRVAVVSDTLILVYKGCRILETSLFLGS